MKASRKMRTYVSSKLFKKYYDGHYHQVNNLRFFWERNTTIPIFFVNKAFMIHKGLYFRRKVFEYYNLAVPCGAFAFSRKPFTPPIKKKDLKKKKRKRIGQIKHVWIRFA